MNASNSTRREALTLFGAAASALLLPESVLAAQSSENNPMASPVPAFDKDPVVATRVSDNLYLLTGQGGNIALLIGEDGPVLIDTGVPRRGRDVAKTAAGVAHHPVTTVINTHFHFDHTGGNETFGKAKARLIAHENTRVRLRSPQTVELFNLTVPASPAIAQPTLTFNDSLTLHQNGQTLHLVHVAPAHTDSDIFVHFAEANLIHAGDLFFNGFYPVIDYSSKGWIGGMVEGMEKMLAIADAQTKIIPGHGPLGDKAALQASRDMLAMVQSRIEPLVKSGKSVEEIVAAKPTADLDAQWGKGLLPADTFVKMAVIGIQRHNA